MHQGIVHTFSLATNQLLIVCRVFIGLNSNFGIVHYMTVPTMSMLIDIYPIPM